AGRAAIQRRGHSQRRMVSPPYRQPGALDSKALLPGCRRLPGPGTAVRTTLAALVSLVAVGAVHRGWPGVLALLPGADLVPRPVRREQRPVCGGAVHRVWPGGTRAAALAVGSAGGRPVPRQDRL